jgi:phosphopantetheinyl transferase (holo-ACP synthase)
MLFRRASQQPPNGIALRAFLERIIDERDRLYDSRFRASEIAVQAALLAQKEAVANALGSRDASTYRCAG